MAGPVGPAPNPPKITDKKERFIASHMMIESIAPELPTKAPVTIKRSLPNIKPALLTALIITFAHTVGEFGVILMIGGSIPNETKVASIAIYEMVEIMDYSAAHIYSAIMLLISFVVLFSVYFFNHTQKRIGGIK